MLTKEKPSEAFRAGQPEPQVRQKLGRDIEAILQKALAEKADDRYTTARELEEDLFDSKASVPSMPVHGLFPTSSHPPCGVIRFRSSYFSPWPRFPSRGFFMHRLTRTAIDLDSKRSLRLSDLHTLQQLVESSKDLPGAHPDSEKALEDWVKRADELVQRRDQHESTLATWSEASTTDADMASLTPTQRAWRRSTLTDLVRELDRFHRTRARTLGASQEPPRLGEEHRSRNHRRFEDLWFEAIETIADPELCPPTTVSRSSLRWA